MILLVLKYSLLKEFAMQHNFLCYTFGELIT